MTSKMSNEDRDRAWKQKCDDARAVKWDIAEPGSNSDNSHGYKSDNYDSDTRAEKRKADRESEKRQPIPAGNTKRRQASQEYRTQTTTKEDQICRSQTSRVSQTSQASQTSGTQTIRT